MTRIEPPAGVRLEVVVTQEVADLITREAAFRDQTVSEVIRSLCLRGHAAEPLQIGTRFTVKLATGLNEIEVAGEAEAATPRSLGDVMGTGGVFFQSYKHRRPGETKWSTGAVTRSAALRAWFDARTDTPAGPLKLGRYRSPDGVEGTIGDFDAFANRYTFEPDGWKPGNPGPNSSDGLVYVGKGAAGWVRLGEPPQ